MKMNVGRLINFLKDCNPEARVYIEMDGTFMEPNDLQEDRMGVWIVANEEEESECSPLKEDI